MAARVLDVGQCDIDHWQISNLLTNHFDVEVDRAKSHSEANQAIARTSYCLVLVNRINDSDGTEGLDFIRDIVEGDKLGKAAVMLVSNYADAQQTAVALGALPGFGKSSLNDETTKARLERVLQS